MEMITGVERRRRWRLEEKLRIVAESEQPGASVSDVARRHEMSRGLLWTWRRQARTGTLAPVGPSVFVPGRGDVGSAIAPNSIRRSGLLPRRSISCCRPATAKPSHKPAKAVGTPSRRAMA